MDPTYGVLVSAVLSTLVAALGIWLTRLQIRSSQRLAERQEDNAELAALRLEFNTEKAERREDRERDQQEIRYQSAVIRQLDDEINELRQQMLTAGLTPPARKAWPTHPQERTSS